MPSSRSRSPSPTQCRAAASLSEHTLDNLVELFQLLAERSRLRILLTLAQEGELNVSALCQRLDQSQPSISHHLTRMRRCGLLHLRKHGKHNYYSLAVGHVSRLLEPLWNEPGRQSRQLQLGEILVTLQPPEGHGGPSYRTAPPPR